MAKIIGNTTATPNPRPDWNQSDETKADYIKNKTVVDNHIKSTNNPHKITKTQIGLQNVDNTSDVNKPISKATQSALDAITDALDIVVANVEANTESINKNAGASASGELISLTDSENTKIRGMKIFGKTKQFSTTGAQLLRFEDKTQTVAGLTWKSVNGVITVSGTATAQSAFENHAHLTGRVGTFYVSGSDATANVYVYAQIEKADGTKTYHQQGSFKLDGTEKQVLVYCQSVNNAAGKTFNATIYPMCNVGTTATPYEPYTGGMPSPNPSYPQALESVGDDGSVEQVVLGKQLIPFPYSENRNTINGVTFTVNDDRSITIDGTSTSSLFYRICFDYYLPAGTYRLSGCHGGSGNTYFTYIEDVSTTKTICSDLGSGSSVTVGDGIFRIYLTVKSGVTVSNATIKPMLRLASITDNTYEPYKSQSLTIPTPNGLGGIPVSSGGNYTDENGQQWICDEIDLERGVYVQRVVPLNISRCTPQRGKIETTTQEYQCFYFYNYLKSPDITLSARERCMCDRFAAESTVYNVPTEGVTIGSSDNVIMMSIKTSRLLDYGYSVDDTTTHVNALLGWLLDNPTSITYATTTPIETPLSEEEIAAYKALHTNYPNTTIYNDEGAYTEVKYVAIGALPSSTTLADIPDDPEHRTVTDEEKAIWNNAFNINAKVNNGVLVLSQSVN